MKSKNKKAKLISVSLLALCFSMLAFGVYALKNASLTVQGTVGFKAHDCMVTVSATIAGDAVLTSQENSQTVYTPDEDGTPSVEREFFDAQQLGRNGVTSKSLDNNSNPAIPEVYFSDLTEDGTPETIVITFTMTNESFYAVTASLTTQVTANKPVTATRSNNGSALLQPSGQQGATQTLIVSFDLGQTEGDYADLSGFEYTIDIDFAKYVAPAVNPDPEPQDPEPNVPSAISQNNSTKQWYATFDPVEGAEIYKVIYYNLNGEKVSETGGNNYSSPMPLAELPTSAGTFSVHILAYDKSGKDLIEDLGEIGTITFLASEPASLGSVVVSSYDSENHQITVESLANATYYQYRIKEKDSMSSVIDYRVDSTTFNVEHIPNTAGIYEVYVSAVGITERGNTIRSVTTFAYSFTIE